MTYCITIQCPQGMFSVQDDKLSGAVILAEGVMRDREIDLAFFSLHPMPSMQICQHIGWYLKTWLRMFN